MCAFVDKSKSMLLTVKNVLCEMMSTCTLKIVYTVIGAVLLTKYIEELELIIKRHFSNRALLYCLLY